MITNNIQTKHNISFCSYNKLNPNTKLSVSTSFYHDYETLQKSVELIENNFVNGADILVYAGSNGEEAISIYSMLHNPERYNIYSIDVFKDAIDYAKRGIYAVNLMDEDSFLTETKPVDAVHNKLKDNFYRIFDKIEKPLKPLNNMEDVIYTISFDGIDNQKYFKLKPEVKNQINFLQGDIRDINTFKTKSNSVGAVFFRNALYHLTNNDLTGVFRYGDMPDMKINRKQILKEVFGAIYKKLSTNGIFIMGDHTQEHFYLADGHTPIEKSVLMDEKRGIRIMSEPPHWKALLEIGNFIPKFSKEINRMGKRGVNIPLIWSKIR